MLHERWLGLSFTAPFLLAACASENRPLDTGNGNGTGQAESAVSVCFFTESAIACSPDPKWNDAEASELRIRVEDFYPSACADDDRDGDRVPDFLDIDDDDGDNDDGNNDDGNGDEADDGDDEDEGHHIEEDHRCHECNRGPGTEGDFRLELDGDRARLDRGRVYLADGNELTVPTPDGSLTIVLSADTRIDDGIPAPGSEIRAEGVLGPDGELLADRVKVLCPAPAPMPPDQVPEDSDPVTPPEG